MSNRHLYLKEEAYFEPLFNHWYAWPYLLSPVTAARHIVNTHQRIMRSFVSNHQLHIMAVKQAAFTGGEFLNCGEDKLEAIKALIADTDAACSDLVALSDAVRLLDEILEEHISGESIEPLYAKVPEPLRGYVEINMDMQHRPSFRLIEPLLYRSDYFKPKLQAASFGLLSRVEERPFVLSTPRLADEHHLQIKADFNSAILETIFRARTTSVEERELQELLQQYESVGGLPFPELFTEEPPTYPSRKIESGVKLHYTGHAGFLLETSQVSILIDPVIPSKDRIHANQIMSFGEIPPSIDFVCLTHNHQDHANLETLLQLRHKTRRVLVPKNNGGSLADPSMRLLLKQLGFDVTEVDDLDEVSIPGGRIVGVPFLGEHGDLHIRSKTAWYIEVLGKKFFFGADSSNPENRLYERLGKFINGVDVLAIGMECVGAPYTWIYGALHTKPVPKVIKNSRRLNGADAEQALAMVKAFGPKQVYVYALGLEPWYKYFTGIEYNDDSRQIIESNKLIAACKEMNIAAEALFGRKTMEFA